MDSLCLMTFNNRAIFYRISTNWTNYITKLSQVMAHLHNLT